MNKGSLVKAFALYGEQVVITMCPLRELKKQTVCLFNVENEKLWREGKLLETLKTKTKTKTNNTAFDVNQDYANAEIKVMKKDYLLQLINKYSIKWQWAFRWQVIARSN